jgi:D-threo-aldose 1-dehydrogenase
MTDERVPLGSTDVRVPRLGLGTGPLGGWPTAVPEDQALATMRHAWETGIRYFDTAPFYGHGLSEERLGSLLPGFDRDAMVLSTKVGRLLVPGDPGDALFKGVPDRVPVFDFSYEGTLRSLEESRARLGSHLDVALIHDPDNHHQEALDGAYRALAELRGDGAIRAIGVGMIFAEPLARFIEERDFDCVLLAGRYTLLEQDCLDGLMATAIERGVSVVAGGVLNSGLLADPGPDSTYDYAPAPAAVVERALRLKAVCDEFGVPLRAAALQFPLAHPAVSSIVIGARTPEEVDDTRRMLELELPAGLWTALKERDLIAGAAPTPGAVGPPALE